MANWKLTIAGVDKRTAVYQPTSPQITLRLNNRSEMRFTLAPGYIPNKYDDVVAYAQDGVTKLFGGLVTSRRVYAHTGSQLIQTTVATTDIIATDYLTYGDWCFTSRVYSTSVTLKQVLTDLVSDCFGTYGVTLSGSQVTGPTLPAFSWNNTSASDALRALFTSTGYVAIIDPNKVLSMFVPGTSSAPFTITDASPNCDGFEWIDSTYTAANKVILTCGPSGTNSYAQSWTQAGSATSWQADIPEAAGANPPGYVTVGGVNRPIALTTGWAYQWDRTTSPPTLRLGTDPTPGNGTVLALTYTAQYPFNVTATGAGSPVRAALATDTTITTLAAGQTEANGLLAILNLDARVPTVWSRQIGWLPGQLLTVNITSRGTVNTTFTIGDTQITLISDTYWVYQFQATETATYQGNAQDKWRSLLNTGGGTAIALAGGGSSGGSSTTVLASPFFLGGSRKFAEAANPAAWLPVIDFVPYTAPATFSGRIRVQLFARLAGIGVTARLFDITASSVVTTTSKVTNQTATEVTAVGVITTGHVYRLEMESDTNGGEVYAIGCLEAA